VDITHQSETKSEISPIFIFALTLFCSASLMFVLQPMFGKALLPLLGGSASVWNTCMVFYQSILFIGYLYAHLLSTRLGYHKHLLLHASLLFISLSFLPIGISESIHPPTSENPSLWLLSTLFGAIGLPFFILSTTSPLLQKWFSRIGHKTSHDPYYLSIASNSGSLIALLSYPFLLEPAIGISLQQQYWSIGFLLLCSLIAVCMMKLKRQHFQTVVVAETSATISTRKPKLKLQLYWLLLSFVPSSLLLGTTNFISIDIATVPLLWVIPLALYLLTFILVFSKYSTAIHKRLLIIQPWVVTPFLIYYFSPQKLSYFSLELFIHLLIFFISTMICHGELAKKRPSTHYLTQYYLIMSLGGMLGGIFNSFVAPFIFSSIYEYPLMIVSALLLNPIHKRIRLYVKQHHAQIITCTYMAAFSIILYRNINQFSQNTLLLTATLTFFGVIYFFYRNKALYFPLFGFLIVSCATPEKQEGNQLMLQSRNFYGVLSVKKKSNVHTGFKNETLHEIYSGTTKHGLQLVSDLSQQCTPFGYYSPQGPLGSIFSSYNELNNNWKIGVVGLGAGEMAGYAKDTQTWTFFELNPAVVDIATNTQYFTYLAECISDFDIQIGDARKTLEFNQQQLDLLVIDAFTSDSIPTHLLTKEAIDLYFSRLHKNGLLVFHISNRYLDLKKVLANHAEKLGLTLLLQEYRPVQTAPLAYRSDWAVLSRHQEALEPLTGGKSQNSWKAVLNNTNMLSWTDDFTSIMSVWK
jgi:hypothetical protein